MRRFPDLAAAGAQVAHLVAGELGVSGVAGAAVPADASETASRPVVVAVLPEGAAVARAVAVALDAELVAAWVRRDDAGPVVELGDGTLADRDVIVAAAAVETGQAAAAVAVAVRERRPRRLRLAAAVCPREAQAGLGRLYETVWAVERPLARRAAAWHFDVYDVPSRAEAAEIIGLQA